MAANKLLIVDDDPDIRELLSEIAEGLGFEALLAEESADVAKVYQMFAPGLIILDLQMPGVDGAQALKALSSVDCKAEIVLFSGTDRRVMNTAARLGESFGLRIAGILQKPIDVDELETMLRGHLDTSSSGLETDVLQALDAESISVHFQPKVKISAGGPWEVLGLEALARWVHPVKGNIPPSIFIPIMEELGVVDRLTDIVIRKAMVQSSKLRESGYSIDMAVNMSPLMLAEATATDRIANIVTENGVDSSNVVVEVTETAAMSEFANAMESLTRFRLKNMKLALDDFGTGFSSLVQLYRMPFSELKIDKSFVLDLAGSEEAQVIVRSIVDLAHNLGLTVCAEGIETAHMLSFLHSIDCDQGQGFLISKPLSEDDLLTFLETDCVSHAGTAVASEPEAEPRAHAAGLIG